MDASINKVLQAVQEEFPPVRKPRRQSSNASSSSSTSGHHAPIPIMDDNHLPTSSELYSYSPSQRSPDPNSISSSGSFGSALSTSPAGSAEASSTSSGHGQSSNASSLSSAFTDGQETPRAERTAPLSAGAQAASSNSNNDTTQYLPQREEVPTSSALPPRIDTQVQYASTGSAASPMSATATATTSSSSSSSRSPRQRPAPSFISLPPPPSSSSSNNTSTGFKPSAMLKSEGLMLTPGGDDIPFQFKTGKRPGMQDRRPSREIFA